MFTYDNSEKDHWVSENSELGKQCTHIIDDYIKKKNFDLSKITSLEKKLCVDKTMLCLNKSKTRGIYLFFIASY